MRLLLKISLLILEIFFFLRFLSHSGKTPNLFLWIKIRGRRAYQFYCFSTIWSEQKSANKRMETLLSDNTQIKPDTSNNVAAAARSILFQHVLALFAEVRKLFTTQALLQLCSGVVSTLLKCARVFKCSSHVCTHLVLHHWRPFV